MHLRTCTLDVNRLRKKHETTLKSYNKDRTLANIEMLEKLFDTLIQGHLLLSISFIFSVEQRNERSLVFYCHLIVLSVYSTVTVEDLNVNLK